MLKQKKIFSLWGPVLFWMGIIFLGSSLPTIKTAERYWWDFALKKTAHLIEYFVLGLLLNRALKGKSAITAAIIAVLYAISDEFHQSFTPGREATFRDIFIDIAGALVGLWYLKQSLPKMPLKLKNWLVNSVKE